MEFESTEIAEEMLKENKEFELADEKVKASKHPPWGKTEAYYVTYIL